MKTHRWKDVRNKKLSPEARKRVDRKVEIARVSMKIRELREILGMTQSDVADGAGIAQGDVSKIERRGDLMLSTLRKIVTAMGGDLEVVARIGDKQVRLEI